MTNRFILHVGAHKTGTTAIQLWLSKNVEVLAGAGIVYPVEIKSVRGNFGRLARALATSSKDREDSDRELVQQLVQVGKAAPEKDILISAEFLERAVGDGSIKNVVSTLQKRSENQITAILYTRNQVDKLNSSYTQKVRSLDYRKSFAKYLSLLPGWTLMDWSAQRDRIRAAGMVDVIGFYGDQASRGGVLNDFLQISGVLDRLPQDVDLSMPRANPSLGEVGMFVAHLIQQKLATELDGINRQKDVSDLLLAALKDYKDTTFNGFDEPAMLAIAAEFAETNQRMNAEGGFAGDLTVCRSMTLPKSAMSWAELSGEKRDVARHTLQRVAELARSEMTDRKYQAVVKALVELADGNEIESFAY